MGESAGVPEAVLVEGPMGRPDCEILLFAVLVLCKDQPSAGNQLAQVVDAKGVVDSSHGSR